MATRRRMQKDPLQHAAGLRGIATLTRPKVHTRTVPLVNAFTLATFSPGGRGGAGHEPRPAPGTCFTRCAAHRVGTASPLTRINMEEPIGASWSGSARFGGKTGHDLPRSLGAIVKPVPGAQQSGSDQVRATEGKGKIDVRFRVRRQWGVDQLVRKATRALVEMPAEETKRFVSTPICTFFLCETAICG